MGTLIVTHNAGFFSCSTQRLRRIMDFFNSNKECPTVVDSSRQFEFYKTDPNSDLTPFFYVEDVIDITYNDNVFFTTLRDAIDHHSDQFEDYKLINFDGVIPFVKKYFKPSQMVVDSITRYETKYNLDYNNLCSVLYRGNDKCTETNLGSYSEYIDKCREIKDKHPGTKFLVQTDDTLFLQEFISVFSDAIFIEDIPTISNNSTTVHYQLPIDQRVNAAINFLAATHIVSKSKIVVTHSGNCGLWAVLFRGNSNNVIQYLKNNVEDKVVWYE